MTVEAAEKAAVVKPGDTLAHMIDRMKPEIARALPKHLDPDRLARIATTVMRSTPMLRDATPASFLGALMTCAQLGLEPGPLGHAYLVPFKNHRRTQHDRRSCDCPIEVTFIPGYRGLVDLARRSGQVASVRAYVVRDGDEFEYRFGLEPNLYHRPKAGPDSPMTHVYSVIRYTDPAIEPDFEVMTRAEVDAIRKRSKASDNGPWVSDYDEMAKKTVLKRHLKTAPLSVEYQRAAALDGTVRTDVSAAALDVTPEPMLDGEVIDPVPALSLADLDDADGASPDDPALEA